MKKRPLFIVKKHKRSKNKQKTNIYRNQMKKKISYRQSIVKIESIGSEMTNKTNAKHTERKICLLYLFLGETFEDTKGVIRHRKVS